MPTDQAGTIMRDNNNIQDYRAEAIRSFRLGMNGQASESLVKFIDCLTSALQKNAAALGSAETHLINAIFEAQSRGDYLYLADLLEYELPKTDF